MAFHNTSTIDDTTNNIICISDDYSGDERDSHDCGDERTDSDLNDKPIYLLEHLATFTVNKDSGIVYPADGMRRLLQLEKSTGIWSQKMQLCLNTPWVLIMDYETGNIIERFPATLIQEPTAFTSTDSMELYNNILVFIVSGSSGSRSEMHIFQSQSVSAVHLVEDLQNLRSGKIVIQQREVSHNKKNSALDNHKVLVPSIAKVHREMNQYHTHHSRHADQYELHTCSEDAVNVGNDETDSEQSGLLNDENCSTSSDKYERDVTVLNHCFDDIEKFIARLQHAAAASRELERRRRNRKTKKKDPGEGLLTLRTRPPHEKEFVDIFAKFKLSFNLLAKLKSHIHDPNAPELVHFLFTPLALIVEASSDTYDTHLAARVINPLLTREAINLLINCVTSKETELWRSLGDSWIIPRDQWKDNVGSYHPVFLDGWSPDHLVIDEIEPVTRQSTNINKHNLDKKALNSESMFINGHTNSTAVSGGNYENHIENFTSASYNYQKRMNSTDHIDLSAKNIGNIHFNSRDDVILDLNKRNDMSGNTTSTIQTITTDLQNMHTHNIRNIDESFDQSNNIENYSKHSVVGGAQGGVCTSNVIDDQLLETWLDDLQATNAKIVLVTYPRTANNDKELSVVRGEYLEVLDDTRKWWKARNMHGEIAHVPHTIVTPYNYGDIENINQPNVPKHSSVGNTIMDQNEQRFNNSTDLIRNKHLGKKGEFRYF